MGMNGEPTVEVRLAGETENVTMVLPTQDGRYPGELLEIILKRLESKDPDSAVILQARSIREMVREIVAHRDMIVAILAVTEHSDVQEAIGGHGSGGLDGLQCDLCVVGQAIDDIRAAMKR